jgi:hypothetical protein
MKKENVIIIILSCLFIIILVLLILSFIQKAKLESENINLLSERGELKGEIGLLRTEKNLATDNFGQCQNEKQLINTELSMLKDDLLELSKSCITENACKTHFPNIRWICNVNGDAVANGDKICYCDTNCNLKFA